MITELDSIKRKLLIKYPTFGSIIANVNFQSNNEIDTAGTDGKVIFYNPIFLRNLEENQQLFLFAHEISHIAFEHIFRSEGKDKDTWDTATDAVINALLKQDGLAMIEGVVDIPEAINYDAEEMYNKLLKEKKEQEKLNPQSNQRQQNSQNSQKGQNSQCRQEKGHDTHSLWDKAIEERKKEGQQQSQGQETSDSNDDDTKKDKKQEQLQGKEMSDSISDDTKNENKKEKKKESSKDNLSVSKKKINSINQEKNKLVEQGERKTFEQNRIERKKRLQELSKELAKQSSHDAGNQIQRENKELLDIGISSPLIDWKRLLRQAIKYDEDWTRKNARIRNGFFRHRLEQIPIPETEILLDTSGSVSETLLKNFLRECKSILENSRVKVGCFNTEFHGFTEIRKIEDIDNIRLPIGGGTNFDSAVKAFSRRACNKIIFTDGQAPMPKETIRNVIWVVFGDEKINPKGGKVIYITGGKLRKLYCNLREDKSINISR